MASTATSPSAGGRSRVMDTPGGQVLIDSETDTLHEVDSDAASVELERGGETTDEEVDETSLALSYGEEAVDDLAEKLGVSEARMMKTVRVLGGAMIGIAVLVVVLSEVFSLEVIANSSGPFSSVIDSLETTGGAALGLLVIGLLVLAANRVMGFFGGGGF